MNENLRAVAIVDNPPTAWERWRLVHPYWRLRQLGVDVRCASLDGNGGLMILRNETVILPRVTVDPKAGRASAERWLRDLRKQAGAVIYEADDDIFTDGFDEHIVSSDFRQGLTDRQLRQQRQDNRWFVAQCDGVTVSSEPLAEIVRTLTDRPVVVVPNALDVRWFRAMLPPRAPWADVLTIGWAGGRRPERDLAQMALAWGRIAKRYPSVRFVVAAPEQPSCLFRAIDDDSRIIYLPWQSWEDYPRAYQVDIGCCAVADTPFSRAKTPIKAWEYAAAGAAVVATPTLYGGCMYESWLVSSQAQTADEWESSLSRLIEGGMVHRFNMSGQMMNHVIQHHSLDTQAMRWHEAYASILAR